MATKLKAVSEATKKGAVFLAVGLVVFLVLRFMFNFAVIVFTPPKPTPSPYINPKFSMLPKLAFPETVTSSKDKRITLETVSGTIPVSTGSAVVYEFVQSPVPDLDFGEKSKKIAANFGIINTDPVKFGDNKYLFVDSQDSSKQFELDYIYYNYHLKYLNPSSYIAIEKGNTIPIERAKQLVYEYLEGTRVDIMKNETRELISSSMFGSFNFFDPVKQETQPVPNIQAANITTINIIRRPIGPLPVIGASTTQANMNFSFTGITASGQFQSQFRILENNLTYWNIIPSTEAVYLIRPADSAFYDDLLKGNGYILNKVESGDEFLVRTVYLAYYEPPTLQKYMIPVWVFEGDKRTDSKFLFRAVVPAIAKGYITE
jgi:hypothetical protein